MGGSEKDVESSMDHGATRRVGGVKGREGRLGSVPGYGLRGDTGRVSVEWRHAHVSMVGPCDMCVCSSLATALVCVHKVGQLCEARGGVLRAVCVVAGRIQQYGKFASLAKK